MLDLWALEHLLSWRPSCLTAGLRQSMQLCQIPCEPELAVVVLGWEPISLLEFGRHCAGKMEENAWDSHIRRLRFSTANNCCKVIRDCIESFVSGTESMSWIRNVINTIAYKKRHWHWHLHCWPATPAIRLGHRYGIRLRSEAQGVQILLGILQRANTLL